MKAKDLRNSILQLAVQGKLVPQDPNDEPASALVERIRAERAKLIKEKKIKAPKGGESVIYRASDGSHYEKRGKGEPVCIDDEIPFEIPESWAWSRFSSLNLGSFTGPFGSALHKSDYVNEGIPVVNPADIVHGYVAAGKMVSKATRDRLSSYVLKSGDFVIGRRGEMGRAAIITDGEEGWLCGTGCFFAHMPQQIEPDYWRLLFSAPLVVNQLESKSVGTTMKNLNLDILGNLLIPMPPSSEQVRICGQVNEAFEMANQYGALEEARERLDAELPDKLRKSVLQIAVQGKLVDQDPADEPASALLDRIRAERAALVKAKKIRAPKGGESVIYRASDGGYYEKRGKGEPQPLEVPFEIPEGWEWARLGSVASIAGGATPDKGNPSFWNGGIPWASVKDLKGDQLESTIDTISEAGLASKTSISQCTNGDLIVATRLVPGKSIICRMDCTINQDLKRVRTMLDIEYVHIWFQSERPKLHMLGQGTTVPGIKVKDLEDALIPVPPKVEQHRIVTAYAVASQSLTNQ